MLRTIAVALAAGLCGCMSAAEEQAHFAAFDDAKCKSYGAQAGTPAYVQCRAQMDAARTAAIASMAATPSPTYTPIAPPAPPTVNFAPTTWGPAGPIY